MMWIRSQDEKHLLKVEHLYITTTTLDNLFKEKDEDLIYDIRTSSVMVGQYSTKEKALKVLDEIEKAICYGNEFYQMPKDDEVEEDE